MSIQEIKSEIAQLPPDDLAKLAQWFDEFQAEAWDRQIAREAKGGRFEEMLQTLREQRECEPMTLNLSPQIEAKLTAAARQSGVEPAVLVEDLLSRYLPEPIQTDSRLISEKNAAAIAQLQAWLKEEATDDPEEIRKSEEELAEFKRNMNANRAATGERLVFP